MNTAHEHGQAIAAAAELADRLEKHLEMLANRSIYVSLIEWNVVSNDILRAAHTLRLCAKAEPTQ